MKLCWFGADFTLNWPVTLTGRLKQASKTGRSASFPGAATKISGAVSTAVAANQLNRGKNRYPKSSFSVQLPFCGHPVSRRTCRNDNFSSTLLHYYFAPVRAALDPSPHSPGRGSSQSVLIHPAADTPLRSQMISPIPALSPAPVLPVAFVPSTARSPTRQTDTTRSSVASISAGNAGMDAENRAAGPASPHTCCISPAVFQGHTSYRPSWLYACISPI